MATVREQVAANRAARDAARGPVTAVPADEPVADPLEVLLVCPNCGASGDDPCVTPSGKVKDTWHAKRGS